MSLLEHLPQQLRKEIFKYVTMGTYMTAWI